MRSAWPRVGRVFGTDEFAAELEREERVAAGRLLNTDELGPGQLEAEPLLEQRVDGAELSGPSEICSSRAAGKVRVELDRTRRSPAPA